MKKDIDFGKVEGVYMAIAREESELAETIWKVFIINENNFEIDNVIINSKGYGEKDGVKQETSVLRHFVEKLAANSIAQVELIQPDVFHLNNEYWVSYYLNGRILDKKFIFVPDSIIEENITLIPALNLEGVLHG